MTEVFPSESDFVNRTAGDTPAGVEISFSRLTIAPAKVSFQEGTFVMNTTRTAQYLPRRYCQPYRSSHQSKSNESDSRSCGGKLLISFANLVVSF